MRAVVVGPGVHVPAHLVAALAKLARIGSDEVRRRDGVVIGGEFGELLADLERIGAVPFPSTQMREQAIEQSTEASEFRDGNGPRLVSVGCAALRLKIGEPRVRQLLRSGDLAGLQVGRTWQVDATDLDRLINERKRAS